nr:hypothetical protein [Xanthomonas axonopodis]
MRLSIFPAAMSLSMIGLRPSVPTITAVPWTPARSVVTPLLRPATRCRSAAKLSATDRTAESAEASTTTVAGTSERISANAPALSRSHTDAGVVHAQAPSAATIISRDRTPDGAMDEIWLLA